MPRVVFYTASSLNGFLADEQDSLDWLFAVPADDAEDSSDALFPAFLDGIGVIVEGSTTYEWVLRHESVLQHPEKWQKFYGDRATFVFTSRTLPVSDGANVRFVHGPVIDAWPSIRQTAGDRDVWIVGGGDLAGQFADAGLLDELQISIAPAALTHGRPLLPRNIGADQLRLESVSRKGQFARLVYTVVKGGQ